MKNMSKLKKNLKTQEKSQNSRWKLEKSALLGFLGESVQKKACLKPLKKALPSTRARQGREWKTPKKILKENMHNWQNLVVDQSVLGPSVSYKLVAIWQFPPAMDLFKGAKVEAETFMRRVHHSSEANSSWQDEETESLDGLYVMWLKWIGIYFLFFVHLDCDCVTQAPFKITVHCWVVWILVTGRSICSSLVNTLATKAVEEVGRWRVGWLFFKWRIIEQFFDEVNVAQEHPSAAVPLQTHGVQSISVNISFELVFRAYLNAELGQIPNNQINIQMKYNILSIWKYLVKYYLRNIIWYLVKYLNT